MACPHVQITAGNQVARLRRHLDGMLPRFVALPGVVGITLNGGMSRGYADDLSEVDVTLVLTPAAFEAWARAKPPVATGITVLDGQLYDIKIVDLAAEQAQRWDDVKLWDASYAEILYDPDGLLAKLLAEKLAGPVDPAPAEGWLRNCWWHYALAGEIWIRRGDPVQGHLMFNQAVPPLVKALFAANGERIPHEKWLLHMSRTLTWTPAAWEQRLGAAMSTGDLTVESLKTRKQVIDGLWREVDRFIVERHFPGLPVHVMQRTVYEQLKLLVERGSMSIREWREVTSSGVPDGDPFYPVMRMDGERIVFDGEAAARIGPEEMYGWHYAVLRAVIDPATKDGRADDGARGV